MYKVSKLHLSGNLKGVTTKEVTSVQFELNKVYKNPIGGSSYKVVAIEEAIGTQEPSQDERIFNRRMPDGSFRPISQFFDKAAEGV